MVGVYDPKPQRGQSRANAYRRLGKLATRLWNSQISEPAMMPDSAVSRRHAGPVIMTEDGWLTGR